MNNQFLSRLSICLVAVVLLAGCQRAPAKRTYHEIVQGAPQQPPPAPMMPAFGEARQGRPMSGELDMSSIPDDDVHAFCVMVRPPRPFPMMIFTLLLREGQAGASGAMPMTAVRLLWEALSMPKRRRCLRLRWRGRRCRGPRRKAGRIKGQAACVWRLLNRRTPRNPWSALISLAGDAGGLESNAARWMRQVNIAVPEAPAMENSSPRKRRSRPQTVSTPRSLT